MIDPTPAKNVSRKGNNASVTKIPSTPPNNPFIRGQTVRVKIRGVGRNPEGYARVRIDGQSLRVELREPAWAPAKGQPVVFYDGDLVVGGGILADCRR